MFQFIFFIFFVLKSVNISIRLLENSYTVNSFENVKSKSFCWEERVLCFRILIQDNFFFQLYNCFRRLSWIC